MVLNLEKVNPYILMDNTISGVNDVSRVRVQLSSSRVVNISSRAYSNRALIESSPSSS